MIGPNGQPSKRTARSRQPILPRHPLAGQDRMLDNKKGAQKPMTVHMTPDAFRRWRKRHYKSRAAAAKALGRGERTIVKYEMGELPVPKHIALACAAISLGITQYPGPEE